MKTDELIDRLESAVNDLRKASQDKEECYLQHNLKLQAAAIAYKTDAYNEVLSLLREAKRQHERDKSRCYVYESNLTDVMIQWQ